MKNLITFLFIFLFCSSQLFAQWISGIVETPNGEGVKGVKVSIDGPPFSSYLITDESGEFSFTTVPNDERIISFEKTDNILNGVSTYDLVLISKSIFGIEPITNPYHHIAGDMNNSGYHTTLDMFYIYEAILDFDSVFQTTPSWQFVRDDYVFDDPLHPVVNDENTTLSVADYMNGASSSFVAIKMGDVNGSVNPHAMVIDNTLQNEIEQIRESLKSLFDLFQRE